MENKKKEKTKIDIILPNYNSSQFIIRTIKSILDQTYKNFSIVENDNEINVFFDDKTFNLVGWQTKDIYQNINVTYLYSIKKNQKVNKNLFKLPTQN